MFISHVGFWFLWLLVIPLFVFSGLHICLFVCFFVCLFLVLISVSEFSSLLSHFNVSFLTLFVLLCSFNFVYYSLILMSVFVCNIYCFVLSFSGVFLLETFLTTSSKRIVQLLWRRELTFSYSPNDKFLFKANLILQTPVIFALTDCKLQKGNFKLSTCIC